MWGEWPGARPGSALVQHQCKPRGDIKGASVTSRGSHCKEKKMPLLGDDSPGGMRDDAQARVLDKRKDCPSLAWLWLGLSPHISHLKCIHTSWLFLQDPPSLEPFWPLLLLPNLSSRTWRPSSPGRMSTPDILTMDLLLSLVCLHPFLGCPETHNI